MKFRIRIRIQIINFIPIFTWSSFSGLWTSFGVSFRLYLPLFLPSIFTDRKSDFCNYLIPIILEPIRWKMWACLLFSSLVYKSYIYISFTEIWINEPRFKFSPSLRQGNSKMGRVHVVYQMLGHVWTKLSSFFWHYLRIK